MKKELKEIIKKSGNNLHIDIADLLEKMGWGVNLSSYYYDDTANKPREIDIVAQKNEEIRNSSGEVVDKFKVFLFIECKYFKNELAFRMRKNQKQEAEEAIIIEGIRSIYGGGKRNLLEGEKLFQEHHYLKKFL